MSVCVCVFGIIMEAQTQHKTTKSMSKEACFFVSLTENDFDIYELEQKLK